MVKRFYIWRIANSSLGSGRVAPVFSEIATELSTNVPHPRDSVMVSVVLHS